jgi:hypothetical protein
VPRTVQSQVAVALTEAALPWRDKAPLDVAVAVRAADR